MNGSSISRKAVLIIGTDTLGAEQFFTNELAFEAWCKKELDASLLAEVTSTLVQISQRDVSPVATIVRKIKQQWKHVDGVVCILPPKQFLRVATQLAFEIGPIGKPVVCATAFGQGGQSEKSFYVHPLLPLHVMNAVQVATVEVSGVVVVGGSEVFPATHAVMGGHDTRLTSADRLVYGHVDFGVRKTFAAKPLSAGAITPRPAASGSVAFVDGSLTRDTFLASLAQAIDDHAGIVVTNGPASLQQVIDAECPKKMPILLCEGSRVHICDNGEWGLVEHLTVTAAAAKFAWILTHKKNVPSLTDLSLAEAMQIDLIGETLL